MGGESRRTWLQRVGLFGAVGLAGCGESNSPAPTETPSPSATGEGKTTNTQATSTVAASIDVETTVEASASGQQVAFAGEVAEPRGIAGISITVGGQRIQREADGETRLEVDENVTVGGGRRYIASITVRAVDGSEQTREVDLGLVPTPLDPVEPARLVGAHYYPWYEMHAGHQNWTDDCVSSPVLGEYAADDAAVVDQHLRWCLNHGIRWLSVSWWGPESGSDRGLNETHLDADLFQEVEFSILYETVGRLGQFDYDLDTSAARNRLRDDFEYLRREYFSQPNYLQFDDRPVVFFYATQLLQGDIEAAFESAAADAGVDIYLLADVQFGVPPSTKRITTVADAVTSYNPYTSVTDIEAVFHDLYERGNTVLHLGAEAADLDYVPVVIPGFNDTEIPDSQRKDNPILETSPERYERVCSQVAPHLGDAEAVLVTSFNEWYENTQIEPSETSGDAYLKLTRDRLATGSVPEFNPTGTRLRLVFNKTVVPAEQNPDSNDTRELAFLAAGLRFTSDGDAVAEYDIGTPEEPVFLEGTYSPESSGNGSWRWMGGRTGESTVYVPADVSSADTGVLIGDPVVSDAIEATVYVDGTQTDQLAFGARDGVDTYPFALE